MWNPTPRLRNVLPFLWLAWMVGVLSAYYTQLWRALGGRVTSPSAWTIAPPDERIALPLFAVGTLAMSGITVLAVAALVWRARGSYATASTLTVPQPLAGCAILLSGLAIVLPLWRDRIVSSAAQVQFSLLPAFGEAVARAGIGIAVLALVVAAAAVTGRWVARALNWRGDSWRETVTFSVALGFAVISYAALILATLGLYRPLVIGVLLAVIMLIAGAAALKRGDMAALKGPASPAGRGFPPSRGVDAPRFGGPAEGLAEAGSHADRWAQAAIFLAILIAFWAALAPETEYDALWYHLELPRQWLQQGGPVDRIEDYVSLYPLTWELVFGVGLALGGDVAARLLHFACLPLIAIILFEATKRFGAGSPWVACALFATVPTVIWQASTAYVDLALALHLTLALYALLRYATGSGPAFAKDPARSRRSGSLISGTREGGRVWLVMAAIQFGVAAATKHLGLAAMAIAASMLVVARIVAVKKSGVMTVIGRDALIVAIRPALVLVAIALIFPAPWYVRNWLLSGNPVFPEMFEVFGAYPPERWDMFAERGLDQFKAHFGRPRTFLNMLRLPWDVTVHGALYGGSLGPLLLILLPGVLVGRAALKGYPARAGQGFPPPRESETRRCGPAEASAEAGRPAIPALIFAGAYFIVWASPVSSFQLRFLVPIVPLLAFAAAEAHGAAHALVPNVRTLRPILGATIGVLLLLNLPPLTPLHETDRREWDGWLTHVIHVPPLRVVIGRERAASYLARLVPSYRAWQYVNEQLPASAKILTFSGGDAFFARRPRISTDATVARPAVWGARVGQEDQVKATLRELGVTHLLVDRRALEKLMPGTLAIGQSPVLVRDYRLEYDDGRFTLYRVGGAAAMRTAQR
jgi:hypothetical protein